MAENLKVRVETTDENVVVTLPGTKCMAKYAGRLVCHGLHYFTRGEMTALQSTKSAFMLAPWQLASEKARELGWIV
jgi:hypothetical protein